MIAKLVQFLELLTTCTAFEVFYFVILAMFPHLGQFNEFFTTYVAVVGALLFFFLYVAEAK